MAGTPLAHRPLSGSSFGKRQVKLHRPSASVSALRQSPPRTPVTTCNEDEGGVRGERQRARFILVRSSEIPLEVITNARAHRVAIREIRVECHAPLRSGDGTASAWWWPSGSCATAIRGSPRTSTAAVICPTYRPASTAWASRPRRGSPTWEGLNAPRPPTLARLRSRCIRELLSLRHVPH
jgi:hypothetical protein